MQLTMQPLWFIVWSLKRTRLVSYKSNSMSTTPVTITPLSRAPINADQIRRSLSDLIQELEHLQAQAEALEEAIEPFLLKQTND